MRVGKDRPQQTAWYYPGWWSWPWALTQQQNMSWSDVEEKKSEPESSIHTESDEAILKSSSRGSTIEGCPEDVGNVDTCTTVSEGNSRLKILQERSWPQGCPHSATLYNSTSDRFTLESGSFQMSRTILAPPITTQTDFDSNGIHFQFRV